MNMAHQLQCHTNSQFSYFTYQNASATQCVLQNNIVYPDDLLLCCHMLGCKTTPIVCSSEANKLNLATYLNWTRLFRWCLYVAKCGFKNKHHNCIIITIFINLGLFWHFEIAINIRTWIKSHKYWRML